MDYQLPPGAMDDVDIRKASRGPMIALIVIIVVLIALMGLLLVLNYQGVISTGPFSKDRVASTISPPSILAPSPSGIDAPRTVRDATTINAAASRSPSAAARIPPPAPVSRGECVSAHFGEKSLTGEEDFSFLCTDKDFRGIASQLHRRLVVAGVGNVTSGMREWASLGWFELAVTAVIRRACCEDDTPPLSLPQTAAGCEQLADVLTRAATPPLRKGSGEERARSVDDAVVCLFRNGIPRPYNYHARPTSHSRATFAAFVERAAARTQT